MRLPPSLFRAEILLAGGLSALLVHRAATRAITIDEAFTWNRFVDPPFAESFASYDANNHLLFTLLARLSAALLPDTELTFRLFALLGGIATLFLAALLAGRLTQRPLLRLTAFALIGGHPLLLDYLCAARGYALALAFLLAAWLLLTDSLGPAAPSPRRLAAAGVLLGLAFSANASYAIPAAALAAAWTALRLRAPWRDALPLAAALALTSLPAALYLVHHAALGNFYDGTPLLRDGILSLINTALLDVPTPLNHPRAETGMWAWYLAFHHGWRLFAATALLSLLAVLPRRRWPLSRPAALTIAATVLSLALLLALHSALNLVYPVRRTALFLLPMLVFCFVLGLEWLWSLRPAARLLTLAPALLIAFLLAQFSLCLPTPYYLDYRFDAGTRDLLAFIDHHRAGRAPVSLGAHWLLTESLNYYRDIRHATWFAPVTRRGIEGAYDYYTLLPEDGEKARQMGLERLYSHPVAESAVAVRPPLPAPAAATAPAALPPAR